MTPLPDPPAAKTTPRRLRGRVATWAAALTSLVGLSAVPAAWAEAAAPRWSMLTQTTFQHLQQAQGLPNEVVSGVTQDGDGFIWVGTAVGVARWDGYRFRLYRPDTGKPGAMADSYIQALHTDTAGRVWIGTNSTGLARYDRETDRFVTYPVGANGLSHVSVRSIADDGAGGLWVGTEDGLDHLDPASGVVARGHAVVPGTAASTGLRIRYLTRDRGGRIWISTQSGLFLREPDGRTTQVVLALDGTRIASPTVVAEGADASVWIGTEEHGLYVVRAGAAGAQPVRESLSHASEPGLATVMVTSLVEVQPGEIWVGFAGAGILALDTKSGATRSIRNVPTLPQTLADNDVRALYRDRSGLVWVGGDLGVSRYDHRQSAVLTMFGAPVDAPSGRDAAVAPPLPSPASTKISWILPVSPERVWLGTHAGEVHVIDPSGARVAVLLPDGRRPRTALQPDSVLGMALASDGQVFIATKRGLYRASADARQVERVTLAGRDPAAPTWAVLVDGQTLWVGGHYDGLWALDLRDGTAAQRLGQAGRELTDSRILTLAKQADGPLWIGTRNGLNRYEPSTGALLRIAPDASRPEGLSAGLVSTLLHDSRGRLWVGTYGGGFNILEPGPVADPPRFRHLSTAQGLHDDHINSVLEDRTGNLWFSTDNGIGTIDARSGATRSLRRTEGVAFSVYWTGSAARTSEGELLFGGAGGMTIVQPERVQPWTYSPGLVLTEAQVGGRPVPAERYFGVRAARAGTEPLTIAPEGNSLSMEFAATDFSAPERLRYAYRLEGHDDDWTETSAQRRLAVYTNLPPGDYRLLLRGSNRDGVWATQELAVPVRVLPAWHQTLWFRVGVVIATLMALAAVVQARTRFLREQQSELERKVQERTARIAEMSRALEEKSRVLELTSISDPLTGLRNRRFLAQHIDTEVTASLRRAQDVPVGSAQSQVDTDNVFLLVDIDHFKRVNDVHGHAAGDAVLVQFAQRLHAVMRETDYVVRWGGEEFLAVARNTDRARAEELAERVRAIVADTPFVIDARHSVQVSCSIGYACLPFIPGEPRAIGWEEAVKLADVALLAAKRMGRNGWVGLVAGEAARTDGLVERVHADPQAAEQRREIRLASNQPAEVVVAALAPPAAAPPGPVLGPLTVR